MSRMSSARHSEHSVEPDAVGYGKLHLHRHESDWLESDGYLSDLSAPMKLVVTGVPAGVTLQDWTSGSEVDIANPVGYEITFAAASNGTSSAPQMKWLFAGATAATAPLSNPITMALEPVPEPSSVLALLCGIGGLGGMIRRRKSA